MHTKIIRRLTNESTLFLAISLSVFLLSLSLRHVAARQLSAVQHHKVLLGQYKEYISSEDGYKKLHAEIAHSNALLTEKYEKALQEGGNGGTSGLLELLIDKAQAADIRFVKMQPQVQSVQNGITVLPVILAMTTSFNSLGRLTASLESIPHIARIDRLALENAPEGKIQVHMLVTCFLHDGEE